MFRILGEVDAHVDGRRLDVGHARQRCVLVCLLVDVNRPVSTDQLIDRVWADAPPQKARNAVAAYISRLRHLLADADDTEIVRGPGGYTLRADAHSVDLHLFRHQVDTARKITDPGAAANMFDRALTLWRGEPISEVETPWIDGIRNSLEHEHLSVALDRNDAALAAGRHAELLTGLPTMWQAYPLDERVVGQLMLAQYRSGRQDQALDTYRVMRERLVEQLGVDPSPLLAAVHRQILTGDPAHPAPPPGIPPNGVVLRRPTRLIGRDGDVQKVRAALRQGSTVTLTGVGGVGKTRLALASADELVATFADGVCVCELAPLRSTAVSQAVGTCLRLPPGQDLGSDDAVVAFLRPRELLLVVDNCEHVLTEAAQLIDRIGRSCPRVKILATSRQPLGIDGERVLPVPPLGEVHATELFGERARASRPDFALDDEPAGVVAEICRRLDGVPLAIELAAARMRAMSSTDVARRLDRLRLLSGGARTAHPRQQSVAATIDWSYHLLSEPEQSLFTQLSVFAGGFDLEAVHAVCAVDIHSTEDDTLDLLTGLVDKSMVVVRGGSGATRYDILETLRCYGRESLRNNGFTDAVASRHAQYYTELIERAAAGIQGADERAWVQRIVPGPNSYTAPDYDNLRAAFERSTAVGEVDLALRLVTAVPELLYMRIGVHCGEWAETVIGLAAPDHPLFVAAVGAAARAAWYVGHYSRARALAGLAHDRPAVPPVPYCAHPADVLADTALYEGDAKTCLAHYERELMQARVSGDPRRLVWILYNITVCHRALHAPEAGLPAAWEAMQVVGTLRNPTAQSMACCALGRALADNDPNRATALFDQARELAASVTNNWLIGIACAEDAAIGAVHGDPTETARIFIEIVDHWELGGPGIASYQWDTLGDITRLLVRLGAHDEAAALHRALAAAGHEPALSAAQTADLSGAAGTVLTGAQAVDLARTALRRYTCAPH